MVRRAAVSGTFYPRDRRQLEALLAQCIRPSPTQVEAKALVAPHAGYVYSGPVAGATYGAVRLPRKFIILCPNHTGLGEPISIMSEGEWETPLGKVSIDSELAGRIRSQTGLVRESPEAHRREHSLEVHLPFLQHLLKNDFEFVPISIMTRNLEDHQRLGIALAEVVQAYPEPVLLIASSDMNHFESAQLTEAKDRMAIQKILELDPAGLHETVRSEHISMCGYGPTAAVLEASLRLGAEAARLVEYSHSGKLTGDLSSVVGYAGLVVY